MQNNKRLKIAMVYPEPLPSQKARSISFIYTAAHLANLDLDVDLFIEKSGSKEEIEKFYNIDLSKVNLFGIRRRFLGIVSNKTFNYFLKSSLKKYDFIYIRHLKTALFLLQKRFSNILFEVHEIFSNTCNSKNYQQIRKMESNVYKDSTSLIFICNTLKNLLGSSFQFRSGYTIYLASRFDFPFTPKDFSSLDEIIYIGNLYSWKGISEFLKYYTKLSKIYPLKIRIIGGPENRLLELKKLTNNIGIDKFLNFESFKEFNEINKTLKTGKLFIVPNSTDSKYANYSTPLKLFEYLSSSSLVVCSSTPPIKEIIKHGYNGFLYDPRNPDSLIKVFEKIFSMNPEERQKIAFNAWKSSRTFADRAKELYELFHLIKEKNDKTN